ncbi:CdvA-like protein [Candidatus Bathyarchaeota archaeon]|nr:CdvA-like protein [Candidatus Bathyarchaeota archaeon]
MSSMVFPSLIGRSLKDENGREIGKIVSFIIDSSGEVKEVLAENKNEELTKYSVERIKIDQEEVFLVSDVEKRTENLCGRFPAVYKKREILEKLFRNKEIMPEIYESLSAELDKSINEMRAEAQSLLNEVERQVQFQENIIKSLHLARTFLEMEHGIGNVRDEFFRQSLLSLLREIKYASYRKMNLLKTKERILGITLQANKEGVEASTVDSYAGQKPVISVRIADE